MLKEMWLFSGKNCFYFNGFWILDNIIYFICTQAAAW